MNSTSYITTEGDAFDALALQFFGEETMAWRIMEMNPDYRDVLIFGAGVQLKIPVVELTDSLEALPPWRR